MSIIMPAFIGPDYSAMQGPCPSGFHIPTKDEWVALCGILTTTFGLASKHQTIGTYLKMPKAGRRSRSDGNYSAGDAYYWSASYYSTSQAYYLYSETNTLSPQSYMYRADGFSIRSFKDKPVTPTSSWTTLYDGSGVAIGAGIFWSSTDGLISVSGDGITWTTIADKNLGATTAYNYGDTLSAANCGNFYQWGNNYGFPHSSTVTTSSTQVDASSYGPGNYYNSSTFIKGFIDWSSVRNNNLRGGVTGVVTNTGELKKRYVWGDNLIQKEIKRVTIRPNGSEVQIRPMSVIVDWLLVGGGGAGGRSRCRAGGGGGGGGVVYCGGEEINKGSYAVVIGAGGTSLTTCCIGNCGNGCPSCFGTIIASGGGGGGGASTSTAGCLGGVCGASAGGSAGCTSTYTAGGTQGKDGGVGCTYRGGGGGGYCEVGCPGGFCSRTSTTAVNNYGGIGGGGFSSEISGATIYYGSGGSGGGYCRTQGYRGGGCGGCYCATGCAATTCGSGGGGAGCTNSTNYCYAGGAGAKGVFILRYPSSCSYNITGGNCCYECNGYCIHCFTSDGTLTVS